MKLIGNQDASANGGSAAFSLVELAIVLVILGLLLGGVLAGASLIRAAERRNIMAQYDQYQTAIQTFRGKYLEIPGDFTKAGNFWGLHDPDPATCAMYYMSDMNTTSQTCNGDGDARIRLADPAVDYGYEQVLFWSHLASAGLVALERPIFIGFGFSTTGAPRGRISKSIWTADNWVVDSPNQFVFPNKQLIYPYGNVMLFGAEISSPTYGGGGVLTPEEIWIIDTKYDDGKPGLGQVHVYGSDGITLCATSSTQYRIDAKASACAIIFLLPF